MAKTWEMGRSPWHTAPSPEIEHVQTKDKIYCPECRAGEPRNECSASSVSGAQQRLLR